MPSKITLANCIINFPTKYHWRDKSNLNDIIKTLNALENIALINDIKSIAIPPLGCGLGGLSWHNVKPHIVTTLAAIEKDRARDNKDFHAVVIEPFPVTPTMKT